MYTEVFAVLRCPSCQSKLAPSIHKVDASGEVISAVLACRLCGRLYPVLDGVADFLEPAHPATPAQVVNEWPPTAWAYERLWRPFSLSLLSGERFSYRRELPLIVQLLGTERGGIFLDIACSNGLYARAITQAIGRAKGHVIGVDHSMPMLCEARRRARAARLRISYVRAEAQLLPIAVGVAAGAAIGGSINEIGDLAQCLAEVRRTLALEGRFVAMALVQAKSLFGRTIQRALQPGGVVFPTKGELELALRNAGLELISTEQHGIVLFSAAVHSAY